MKNKKFKMNLQLFAEKDKLKTLESNKGKSKIDVSVEVKQLGPVEDRTLRFIASSEREDRDGDIIRTAGWNLDNFNKNSMILYMHDAFLPLGQGKNAYVDPIAKKLIIDVRYPTVEELTSEGVKDAHSHALFIDMIYNMYRIGMMKTGSVGFRGTKYKRRTDQKDIPEWQRGIDFEEQELFEFSMVTIPSNIDSEVIRSAKGFDCDDDKLKQFITISNEYNEIAGKSNGNEPIDNIKAADLAGNPSSYDIERAIDDFINPNWDFRRWVVDLYPMIYPSGHAVIRNEDELFLHNYTYTKVEDDVVIALDEGVAIEMTIALKSKMQTKAGAVLSKKNISSLENVLESLTKGSDSIQTILTDAQNNPVVDEKGIVEPIVEPVVKVDVAPIIDPDALILVD